MDESTSQESVQKLTPREWLRLILVYLSIPILLLACGGDVGWWQAWLFSLLFFASGIWGRILAERTQSVSAADVKSWDKVLAPLMAFSISFPLVIVAGLDHRFGWSGQGSVILNVIGISLILIGYAFSVWALVENRFFSSMMRIQFDRGHVVCDSGPYRVVRHPGYAGNILAMFGIALALSSKWTLLPVAFAVVVTVIRTSLEDRALQEELPGYLEYAHRVKARLLPRVY